MANRSYVYRVLEDNFGTPQRGVSVTIKKADGTPFTDSLFTTNDGGSTLSNPFTSADGAVSFYIDVPQRLLMQWRPDGAVADEVQVVDAFAYPV